MKKVLRIITTGMRLELIKGYAYTVLDDSYNSSPQAAKTSLDIFISNPKDTLLFWNNENNLE